MRKLTVVEKQKLATLLAPIAERVIWILKLGPRESEPMLVPTETKQIRNVCLGVRKYENLFQ